MKEVKTILDALIKQHKTPSVQYRIFGATDILYTFQDGFADIKSQNIANVQTTYNAYSVTKTFTALAILQLAEQKKMEIEQSAKKYLPDFPYSSDITVKQLLTHSAGIPNPIPLSWIHLAEEHAAFNERQFFNAVFLKNKQEKSKPNEKFAYSNLGYILLGQIIEHVTGASYQQYIKENIIQKAGIQPDALDFIIPNKAQHATGYHKQWSFSNLILGFLINKSKYMMQAQDQWKPFKNIYVNGSAYGGLVGSADAFMQYIQALLKPDSPLISQQYKRLLFTENHTNAGKTTGMCISWFKGNLNGQEYFAHAGGGGGYYCEIRIYPELGLGSTILFNRTGMSDERFLDKTDRFYI